MAIDISETLTEIESRIDTDARGATDAAELVAAAERAAHGAKYILVGRTFVPTIWPWLEGRGIVLLADAPGAKFADINAVLKKGADGAVLWGDAIHEIMPVRDDLFFNKKLFFGFNMADVAPLSWIQIFDDLAQIRADGIIVCPTAAAEIYGMFNAVPRDFPCIIHIASRIPEIIENAYRLASEMRPELLPFLRFLY